MITKEKFREIEKEYNLWLAKHPRGDYNYKYFSHMRRSVEFAEHYFQSKMKEVIKKTKADEQDEVYNLGPIDTDEDSIYANGFGSGYSNAISNMKENAKQA